MNIKQEIARFVREEEGAGVIEYSLIAAVMAGIIITALYGGVGAKIVAVFKQIEADLGTASTAPAS